MCPYLDVCGEGAHEGFLAGRVESVESVLCGDEPVNEWSIGFHEVVDESETVGGGRVEDSDGGVESRCDACAGGCCANDGVPVVECTVDVGLFGSSAEGWSEECGPIDSGGLGFDVGGVP